MEDSKGIENSDEIESKPIGLSWIGCGVNSVPAGIIVEDLEEEIRKLRGRGD